jgi:hypothetical protein
MTGLSASVKSRSRRRRMGRCFSRLMTQFCSNRSDKRTSKVCNSQRSLSSRTVLFTADIFKVSCGTDQASKSGRMAPVTKVSGLTTKQVAADSSGTPMATSTAASGPTTRRTALADMITQMVPSTTAAGGTISRMVMASRLGRTAVSSLVCIAMA